MKNARSTTGSTRESLLHDGKKTVHDLPYRAPFDPNVNQSHWLQTTLLLIAEVMGAGVLGLPYAFARLGWVLGLVSCVLFAGTAAYAGLLLRRVKGFLCPTAVSYTDVAIELVGPKFGSFTRACVLTTWALLLPYYLLTCSLALQTAFAELDVTWCGWEVSLLVAALLWLPLQMRDLHVISYVCSVSSIAMFVVVALVCYALCYAML
jgi:amino acid permease